ncbi:hypothetical protein LCGC14_2108290, partial [marine sediment metagenome]
LIRDVTTVFGLTIGHTLIVFLILSIIRFFKRRWPSFLIPSIIITTLTFIVIILANIDKYAELAEPQKQSKRDTIEKLEKNEPVTSFAQEEYRDTIPGDELLTKAMIGVWKEIYHQDCLDGESIVIYYPNMRFEEFTTYMANEDCEFLSDGVILKVGEFRHMVTTGTWRVSGGYVYYNTLGDGISSMRIISIDAQRVSSIWDSGYTCESYRIDFHNEELFKRKDEPGVNADGNQDIHKEQSTSSLYQEEEIHFSKIAIASMTNAFGLMIKDVIENYSALDKSRAINILQDWINKVENNAKVISLSVKDSSSYRYDQKYIVTYTISKGSNQNEYMYEYNLNTNAIQKMVYLHDED